MRHKKTNYIEAAMRNRNIVLIFTAIFVVLGIVALLKMPRDEFPPFTIRTGVVVGVYPGATSDEVETQLTRAVENYIFGFKEVDKEKTYSRSEEGRMYLFVELNGDVKNAEQFWSKLKHGLNELKMTLPSGVLALVANSDFGDTAALLITLSSDTKDYKEMEDELKKLEAACRKIPSVSKIKHYGLQKEKIYVNVRPEKLNEYNIKSLSLLASYQLDGMVNYAGELEDGAKNLPIHLPSNFESEKDLAEHIVYSDPNGNIVRLKDIATIQRRYEDPDNYIEQGGKKTILLSLEMQPGNNIVEFGQEVDEALVVFETQCPDDIQVAKISELPKYVKESVDNFMKEFLIAIIAVILVTLILLPFRVASVAALTIPISILITLTFSYITGIELNTVTLAALILVLGMIVDNSIVVIDNYIEKLDQGYSRWTAAIKSAQELFIPIVTATLAILSAFFPLLFFMKGTAAEFVGTFPIVVGISLTASVLVAVLLVPYLNYVFIRKGLKRGKSKQKKKTFLDNLQKWYDVTLEKAFHHPKKVVFTGVLIVILGFAIFPTLNIQLFPELERNQFAVEIYLPTGSSLDRTGEVVDSMATILMNDDRVTNVTSFIGTSSPRFHTVYAPNMPSPSYGQILVNTVSNEATREVANEYDKKYGDYFADAHVKCKILALQKNRNPIEIRITSDSINDIRAVESQIHDILKSTDNVTWIRNDWEEKQQNIRVDLERDRANRLGYSKALVSTSIMAGLNGLPLTTIWEGEHAIEVVLNTKSTPNEEIGTLENLYITSPLTFSSLPLRSIATLSPEWTEGVIVHRNGVRTLTIAVDNDTKVVANSVFSKIKKQVDKLDLPEGTSISYGGEYETSMEELPPVFIALGVSIILIFFILLFQFKKERLSLLIMTTMILGIPGATIGIKLMGFPASLTGLMGITSLVGIVVRNGIILIDYAQALRKKDRTLTVKEAALAAGKRRMRPIFLTSAAASAGVIPMIMGRSMLWGPLGTVICFGLIISMVLTLYILPILYSWILRDKSGKKGFWSIPVKRSLALVLPFIFILLPSVSNAQSLSLDSCKVYALEHNRQIKEAKLKVDEAEQVRKNVQTNFYPKVNAQIAAIKINDYLLDIETPEMNLPVYDGNPENLANVTQFAYVPGMNIQALDYLNIGMVTAIQPIYAGGQVKTGYKLASMGKIINEKALILSTEEVIVKTEEYYWTLVSLQAKQKTLSSYEKLIISLLKDVQVSYDAGLIEKSDLLKVKMKLNEIEANKLKLVNGVEMVKMAMCQHIGIEYSENITLQDTSFTIVTPEALFILPEDALLNRTEYQILNDVVNVEELQKRLSLGEHLPQFAIGVQGQYLDIAEKQNTYAIGFATLSIPISDWWGGKYKMQEHNIKIDIAKNDLDEKSELLKLQMTQSFKKLTESFKQISVAESQVEQAGEHVKVVSDNYDAGIVSTSDLLEAQALLQEAEDNLTDARSIYQINQTHYRQVVAKLGY
ncbi:MAG: efflux RND transporter permease subunit [Mariniphaga sp.]|nr:efflux RND transporter permease subunit [Mariniphaga sp.]